jgi:hypothetical protein
MSIWVFVAGVFMTTYAGKTYGFWEGFAAGTLTIVGSIVCYRLVDRDRGTDEDGDYFEE